ncbi:MULTISPECIES: type II secretion system F family protein [unclassified Acinetobacter]|uniref:type II secretion system F family protein n=1 Tax=unclassified Acinetobacter TaxID=196816 RepID=UPI0029340FCB|nr:MULTISPECIES: type II secretion system F family protein [unclassified Acinetobacter]WOE30615.1 type II secretion system F family protein [Acinetobacter sp. SAAs470]WOE38807.1 type II secretion system F family protein [Acinetobacter sp. SAAs474]
MKINKNKKMYRFHYEGINGKGIKIKGEITAINLIMAKITLRKQGLNIQFIREKRANIFEHLGAKKVTTLDIAIFTRQLATMLKSGIPLVQSFDIVHDGLDKPAMRRIILGIKSEIESGHTLADALKKYPQYFDRLFCALIESGELSGSLDIMLDRVAIYKEKNELLKQKIKKAIKYPLTVIMVAMIVTLILMLKVVPIFEELFISFGAELPLFTQLIVQLSKWVQQYWLILICTTTISIISTVTLKKRSQRFQDLSDHLALKFPIFGQLVYKSIIARYSRTLATTFAAGVPLIDALESTAGATNNVIYKAVVMQIRDHVAAGQQLQLAMKMSNKFPNMAIQMVAIGEESGALDCMLDKVAIYYENEVDHAVDGLTSMMEPLIMAILGLLIGSLVIAMYLPIFQMGSII